MVARVSVCDGRGDREREREREMQGVREDIDAMWGNIRVEKRLVMQSKIECVRIAFGSRGRESERGSRYCKVPEQRRGENKSMGEVSL